MKKITILIVLALLCLKFSARGQANQTGRPLQTGDQVPDVTITNLLNYPAATARISDFKGKLLIIDFWATWCSPCIAMIPKMDSLQQQFGGKIQFLAVSAQAKSTVQQFMNKLEARHGRHYRTPEVTGDTILSKLFPHRFLPHYVWIDPEGRLAAITEFKAVNAETISRILSRQATHLAEKKDAELIPYNDSIPLLVQNNGGNGDDLVYHSILTKYKPGLPSQRIIQPEKDGSFRILCKNLNPLQLFAVAYMDKGRDYLMYLDSIRLQVRDTSGLTSYAIGMEYDHWLASGHGFCYELKVPAPMKKAAFAAMREEIGRLFPQYIPSIVVKEERCYVLKSTVSQPRTKTNGGTPGIAIDQFGTTMTNRPLRYWVAIVNSRGLLKFPLVDRTGAAGNTDLLLRKGFDNMEDLNEELKTYGLRVEPGTQTINQLVVSDRPVSNPN